ncbi:RNA polymerase sigma factor [Kutzneria kofuensis]|uniref:RNA polymerase sigma factor (Sigma-70 family) n=1 Tax=Kutzneria kofuensis TaxID=103725 RepID=A0A7W9NL53_9PSEU|nr:sigma-70 family RNA polymerase sigma factor [Kutzneria kofuensis]MBB5895958.1 RNA polymerase sigma factor (sigma-70 family) [Kutzneria kofuensis]
MTVDEYGAVRAHALRLCLAAGATVEEAEDCVHEALVELLEVDDPESVRAPAGWVATVSRRRLIDQVRRRSRERVAGQREPTAIAPVDPADLVADRDLARWLVRSIADLPPTTRQVCAAIGDGMSEAEVAQSLGLTARAVESHLTRARRRLRKLRIAVVLPVGVCCARALQRLAAPLTCAAVAAPVAAVMLLPASPAPHQSLPHAESPVAMTTTPTTTATVPPPVVTTTATTTTVTTTTTTATASTPPPVTTTHLLPAHDVVTHVDTVVDDLLKQLPTALPPLPSLPLKLPLDR